MNYCKVPFLAGLAFGLTPLSSAIQHSPNHQVIYSEVQSDPSSSVPGFPGVFIDFVDRPVVSPDGSHWAVTVNINTGSTLDDELLIVDGIVQVVEGTNPAYLPIGRNFGFLDTKIGIANSGAFIFSADLDGDVLDDEVIVSNDGMGNFAVEAQANNQINGAPAGWLNDLIDSPFITNAGFGYETDSINNGPPSSMDNLIMLNNSIFLQTGVDSPTGQFSGLSETWENFDFGDFYISSDGTNWLMQGDVSGVTTEDDLVAVNGVVAIQENYPIPGGPADVVDSFGIGGVFMADSGDWTARGDFDVTNDGWALYNGAIVAQETMPVTPGSIELWDATFVIATCNSVGNYLVGGSTDAATTSDGVLVLNGTTIVCREGEPVDLNGNGIYDDGVFFRTFGTDDAVLTDTLKLYLSGTLGDAGGSNLGEFLMTLDLQEVAGTPFCNPADPNSTGMPTVLTGAFGSGVGSDLHLESTQGPPTQFGYFLVGSSQNDPGVPIGNGHLCVSGSIGRYNIAGTDFNSVGVFDGSGILQNVSNTSSTASGYDVPSAVPVSGTPTIMAGDTWTFQLWHREAGGQANFSNGLSVMF